MSMDYHFLMTSVINTSTFSIFAVVRSLGDSYLMNKDGGNVQVRINIDNANYLSVYPSPKSSDAGTTYTQQLAAYIGNSSTLRFFQNSTSIGTAGNHTINQDVIGGFSNGTQPTTMLYQELVVYNSDQYTAGNQTSIESNIGDYFTQNTPLLDTYSGAAAAYSLRLLDSTYTGSAIRVRRSSDNTEQDIGFNVFSELDTVSLLAFAGTGDAFVKVWYCQSGNSNDATQTDTASQPQIVSSGAVIVENGKPAVEFNDTTTYLQNDTISVNTYPIAGMNVSAKQNTNSGTIFSLVNSSSGSQMFYNSYDITKTRWNARNTTQNIKTATGIADNTSYLNYAYWEDSTSREYYINGVSKITDTATVPIFTINRIGIGRLVDSSPESSRLDGNVQELIIWNTTQDATTRSGIETNVNTFFNLY